MPREILKQERRPWLHYFVMVDVTMVIYALADAFIVADDVDFFWVVDESLRVGLEESVHNRWIGGKVRPETNGKRFDFQNILVASLAQQITCQ